MGFLPNTKITKKIIILPILSIAALIVVAILGLMQKNSLNQAAENAFDTAIAPTAYISEISNSFHMAAINISDIANTLGADEKDSKISEASRNIAKAIEQTDDFLKVVKNASNVGGTSYQSVDGKANDLKNSLLEFENFIREESTGATSSDSRLVQKVETALNDLAAANISAAESLISGAQGESNTSMLIIYVITAVSIIIILIFTALISGAIKGKVDLLNLSAEKIAVGDFKNLPSNNDRDELGVLINRFNTIAETIQSVGQEVNECSKSAKNGAFSYNPNTQKYQGEYRNIIVAVSEANSLVAKDIASIAACVEQFAIGNINVQIPKLSSACASAEKNLTGIKNNLGNLAKMVEKIEKSYQQGDYTAKVNVSEYIGSWKDLAENISKILETANTPIKESAMVVANVSKGNLRTKISGNYKGDAANLKESVNSLIGVLEAYIADILRLPSQISKDKSNINFTKDYVGEFSAIKTAINEAFSKLAEAKGENSGSHGRTATQIAKPVMSAVTSKVSLVQSNTNTNSTRHTAQQPAKTTQPAFKPMKAAQSAPEMKASENKAIATSNVQNSAPKSTKSTTSVAALAGQSRQNVNYNSADALIFENKDFGKY